MKKLSISILMISWCVCLHAQTKTFVLEELFTSRKLYADNLQQLQWVSTSNDFVYVVDSTLMKANVANTNPRVFVPLADINKALLAVNLNTVKNFPAIQHWSSVNGFYFRSQNFLLHYRIDLKQIDKQIPIVKEAENLQIDYDRQQIAYTVENDLFVIKADRQAVQVNKETASDIRFGHIVHRNEFGVEQGSFWSPKGNYLAFYRMDESMVTDYPLVNTSTRIATLKNEKYPMAGETSHQVSLGVYNMNTKTIVYMQTGEPSDQYLTSITWSLDEKYIFIGILNREQNHLKMNQYNAVTGEYVKTLFEEKNERYV
ncbi:MAG TPA: DPP IV N-terminal domain-containing protein, partial [Bacteroidales bacterium]|nr:DPP IV N-terminal domain-containing protein [Bacteroidales bacterium]